jgi:hypothetical protein
MNDEQHVTLAARLERVGGIGANRTAPAAWNQTTLTNSETLHIAENRLKQSDKGRLARHRRSGDFVELASEIFGTM